MCHRHLSPSKSESQHKHRNMAVLICFQACGGPVVTLQEVAAVLDNSTAVRLGTWLDQKKSLETQTENPLSISSASPAEAAATAASLALVSDCANGEASPRILGFGQGGSCNDTGRGPVSSPVDDKSVVENHSQEIKMATTIQAQVRTELQLALRWRRWGRCSVGRPPDSPTPARRLSVYTS